MAFDVSALGALVDQRYPADLAAQGIAALQSARTDWVPRPGSVETLLIEAMALAVADVSNAANQTVAAVEEDVLARLFQVPRRPGTPATGQITVTFDSTVTTTVPAGTGFALTEFGIEVAATADTAVTAATTAVLTVATTEATSLINGVGTEAAIDVLDVIPNLLSVAVTGGFSGGADPEDDAAYVVRARQRLARVTNSLVVPDHFSAYVLEDGRAVNAACIPAWNGTGTVPAPGAGADANHVTVACYGRGGQVPAGDRTALAEAMQAITAEGVTVHVNEASLSSVSVTLTAAAEPGQVAASVQAGIEDALRAYLSPQTWPFGVTVRHTSLIALVAAVPGVDYVASLTLPAADVTLAADQVAYPGVLTVTVT